MQRKHTNTCPDCGAFLDPGERCDCDGEGFADTGTRDRLRAIQAAERGNRQHIAEYIDRRRNKDLHEYLYK